jgi:hypothetical protein
MFLKKYATLSHRIRIQISQNRRIRIAFAFAFCEAFAFASHSHLNTNANLHPWSRRDQFLASARRPQIVSIKKFSSSPISYLHFNISALTYIS